MNENRKEVMKTTINVNPVLWKRFRGYVLLDGNDLSEVLTELIVNYINERGKTNAIS